MSEILDIAHDMAKDLHEVGAMDDITMRVMDELCLPEPRTFAAEDIKTIRKKTRMSQAAFGCDRPQGHRGYHLTSYAHRNASNGEMSD